MTRDEAWNLFYDMADARDQYWQCPTNSGERYYHELRERVIAAMCGEEEK